MSFENPNQTIKRRAVAAIAHDNEKFLVIQRSHLVVAPLHFCFPGGGIEPGETEAEAVIRELNEELNLQVEPLRQVWQSNTPSGYELFWWTIKIHDLANIRPNAEVAIWGWYSEEDMAKLQPLLSSNVEFLKRLATGEIRFD